MSAGSVHSLGCLEQAEAAQAVRRMLMEFRVITTGTDRGRPAAGERPDWPELLASESDGWPMHLHNGMRALAAALVPAGGYLTGVSRRTVLKSARDLRKEHHDSLRIGDLAGAKSLLQTVVRSLPRGGASRVEVRDAIARYVRPDAGTGWSLPKDMDESGFFGLMARRGVLQETSDASDRYVCPIPSFRDYLLSEEIQENRKPDPVPRPDPGPGPERSMSY